MEATLKETNPESKDLAQPHTDPEAKSDEVPDGGYGWVVSLLTASLNAGRSASNNGRL